jgi:alpha/beta superfamily hydrolase
MACERTLFFASSSLNCEGSVAVTNWNWAGPLRFAFRRVGLGFGAGSGDEDDAAGEHQYIHVIARRPLSVPALAGLLSGAIVAVDTTKRTPV